MGALEETDAAEHPVTVLLVEDEYLLRLVIAEELREIGWRVVEVGSADEAMEVVRSRLPLDLVLTDVHMPGRNNGLDLAQAVRAERPAAKIAVMSGAMSPDPGDARFDIFLPKPTGAVTSALVPLVEALRRRPA